MQTSTGSTAGENLLPCFPACPGPGQGHYSTKYGGYQYFFSSSTCGQRADNAGKTHYVVYLDAVNPQGVVVENNLKKRNKKLTAGYERITAGGEFFCSSRVFSDLISPRSGRLVSTFSERRAFAYRRFSPLFCSRSALQYQGRREQKRGVGGVSIQLATCSQIACHTAFLFRSRAACAR